MTGAGDIPSFDSHGPAPTRARLFVGAPLGGGESIGLSSGQAQYLQNVLRLKAGDPVALFNGTDGEWAGTIAELGKGRASVEVHRLRRQQVAEPDLWLLFAPIEHARIDYLAQKATELGVSVLQPVITAHTSVARVDVDRLSANAVEAAQQTGRLTIPHVRAAVPLRKVLADWPHSRRLMLCDESGSGPPVAAALAAERHAGGLPWAVMVGPEGGFAASELDALAKLPFVMPVSLGPRLLRADTAAVAALACWQAALGDWAEATPGS